MSDLKPIEKRGFEDLFGMPSGYVLEFSNATFAQFFVDTLNIDIYHDKYAVHGDSKAKRLRAFWELEENNSVAQVLSGMLDIWEYENEQDAPNSARLKRCRSVVARLAGKQASKQDETATDFLDQIIELPNLDSLKLDGAVTAILASRLEEITKGLKSGAPLSVIFMCGSVLEGVLLGTATQKPKEFNQASCSPKGKTGKVKNFHDWTLAQLIDVACEVGEIKLDVKKFSHVLRDFRNYIHPYEQMASNFAPDRQTAEICFQVLKAALADLGKTR